MGAICSSANAPPPMAQTNSATTNNHTKANNSMQKEAKVVKVDSIPRATFIDASTMTDDIAFLKTSRLGMEPSITQKEKEEIIKTWKLLRADIVGIGCKIFLTIFELQPKVKALFKFEGLTDDQLMRHPMFHTHAIRFMQVIGATVDHIEDIESFSVLLRTLGHSHTNIPGFTYAYFCWFERAIQVVWKAELHKIGYDKVASNAWVSLLSVINDYMQQGILGLSGDELDDTSEFQISASAPPHSVIKMIM